MLSFEVSGSLKGCKCLILCFERDGFQKKEKQKLRQFKQIKNCVAALSMMNFIVYGFLLRQVWSPLP